MPIATSLALGLGALTAGGNIASGIIGSRAAGNAANVQADAATQAAQLQARSAQEALDFQKQQFYTQQQNFAPWLNVGTGAVTNLASLMGITPAQSGGGTQPAPGAPVGGGGTVSLQSLAGPTAGRPDTGLNIGDAGEDAYYRDYFGGEPGTLSQLAANATTDARAGGPEPGVECWLLSPHRGLWLPVGVPT